VKRGSAGEGSENKLGSKKEKKRKRIRPALVF
jgi:hypothetical protein